LVFAQAELVFGVGAALEVAKIFFEEFDAVADGMPTMRQLSDAKRARPIIRPAKVPEELTAEKTSTLVFFQLLDQLVRAADVAQQPREWMRRREEIGAMAGLALGAMASSISFFLFWL